MPGMGKVSAASVAASLRSSFIGIKVVLVVGICGGVPFYSRDGNKQEIILGDVIISDAVIQYDFGRKFPDHFQQKHTLKESFGRPNQEIRGLISKLQIRSNLVRFSSKTFQHLEAVQGKLDAQSQYPGAEQDMLYEPFYRHKHRDQPWDVKCDTCARCETKRNPVCDQSRGLSCEKLGCKGKTIPRKRLTCGDHKPNIHIGAIASGDIVMKSGEDRDEIAERAHIIAFEMEGAGVWDNLPCLVIKGVCDYADSHKNKKFQRYAAVTAAACAKAFLEEWAPHQEIDNHGCWLVPFQRNPNFVGRDSLLVKLEEGLLNTGCFSKFAAFGLGGIGKTQVAIELAYRIRKKLPACSVFWVPSADQKAFEGAYRDIGQKLALSGMDNGETDIKKLVKQHLSQATVGQWLMIFDNADDKDVWFSKTSTHPLVDFVPVSSRGCALLTTRNEQVAINFAHKNIIKVDEMDVDTSKQMLRKLLLREETVDDCVTTERLLDKLSFIPLAVAQAAAFLNEYHHEAGIAKYLSLLNNTDEDLIKELTKDFQDDWRYRDQENAVAATWLVSFRNIKKCNPLAADYLSLMSCVNPKNIPRSILPDAMDVEQRKAISTLASYSFITIRVDGTVDVHRLIHTATRNWLQLDCRYEEWVGKALRQLALVFPSSEPDNRQEWRGYRPHVNYAFSRCMDHMDTDRMFLRRYGLCLLQDGKYNAAEKPLTEIMKAFKKDLGAEHPDTLTSMANLASIYRDQGLLEKVAELLTQVMETRQKVLGEEHQDTLNSMNNLALTWKEQGQSEKAIALMEKCVEIGKQALHTDHPFTVSSANTLKEWKMESLASTHNSPSTSTPDPPTSSSTLYSTLQSKTNYISMKQTDLGYII
ncbi:putative kinesin light chain [Periconia macrospinosa]|uniref:Putative kinesin light chain n=1 Tax=Periconia macrospinosa TaxID=97972 RepID=A0A2V1CYX8_9PLEO|nr:putative kinesin light chain [Periconia macrospinosa]